MEERGLDAEALGEGLVLDPDEVVRLLRGELVIEPWLAWNLAAVLGGTSVFWTERDRLYRSSLARLGGVVASGAQGTEG